VRDALAVLDRVEVRRVRAEDDEGLGAVEARPTGLLIRAEFPQRSLVFSGRRAMRDMEWVRIDTPRG